MADLALFGGPAAAPDPLSPYRSMGAEELAAVTDVVNSDVLSGFFGSWRDGFLGGPQVRALEDEWCVRFDCTHAVSVNSATSGLIAAVGAVKCGPGDEVIVPPTTMSATAMAPLIYGAIPVFADIDPDTFCLNVEAVRNAITTRTRAVIAVNLFGQAAPLSALRALCDEHSLALIEDNAQAPFATENNRFAGTIGHIGVFSLNYHKHIHTGEGGVCTSDDEDLATRLRMIRNHAEAVVEEAQVNDLTNLVGFNFRLTELSAAVGRVQLRNADNHIRKRIDFAETLSARLGDLEGIRPPFVRKNCRHVYYDWIARYETVRAGPSRTTFVAALKAEGFPCFEGYVRPLYHLPLFREQRAIGREGFPFSTGNYDYNAISCPNAERLHRDEILGVEICTWDVDKANAHALADAFLKVHSHRQSLSEWERAQSGGTKSS